jgi:hypothetical protein
MFVGICTITLEASWVCSLKEKRMVLKSIIEKTKHRFNASVAEVDMQDEHRTLVIGVACVSNKVKHADEMLDHIIAFIEGASDAVIVAIDREIL